MANSKKDWTIMVYMAGDNNLSEDMVSGLIGMRENLSESPNLALTAYYDSNARGFPTVIADFTIADPDRRLKSAMFVKNYLSANVTDELANGLQDIDAALPQLTPRILPFNEELSSIITITDFVRYSVQEHPADNYAIIFSGHGDGFQPNNFLRDENPRSSISVRDLHRNLDFMKRNLLGDKKFSIVGFDCCVMNTLEVAYEISDVAETVVGSQGFTPGIGWDYKHLITNLKAVGDEIESKDIVTAINDSFINFNRDFAFYSGRSVEIGSCDLRQIPQIREAVNNLGNER